MFLFLLGDDSKQVGQRLLKELKSRGREAYHLDRGDNHSDHLLSHIFDLNLRISDNYLSRVDIFTSPDLWFLGDRTPLKMETYFESVGGVLMTSDPSPYESIRSREKLPSYQRATYSPVASAPSDVFYNFFSGHLEYGCQRWLRLYCASDDEEQDMSVGGYFGEVLGSPKTIFVSDREQGDPDFIHEDVSFALSLREYLTPSHGNHIGVCSIDSISAVQEVHPYSGYVAIGSNAYEQLSMTLDADIVRAGIPHPRGIKRLTSENESEILSRFAKLASRVVESGQRKTSLLDL